MPTLINVTCHNFFYQNYPIKNKFFEQYFYMSTLIQVTKLTLILLQNNPKQNKCVNLCGKVSLGMCRTVRVNECMNTYRLCACLRSDGGVLF